MWSAICVDTLEEESRNVLEKKCPWAKFISAKWRRRWRVSREPLRYNDDVGKKLLSQADNLCCWPAQQKRQHQEQFSLAFYLIVGQHTQESWPHKSARNRIIIIWKAPSPSTSCNWETTDRPSGHIFSEFHHAQPTVAALSMNYNFDTCAQLIVSVIVDFNLLWFGLEQALHRHQQLLCC